MGYREYRKEKKAQEIAGLVKAAMTANLPAGATVQSNLVPNNTTPTGPFGQFPAMTEALMRNGQTFGAAMGPGVPLTPVALDPGDPRAPFRRYQYDISHNLNINQRQALWTMLRNAAQTIDVIARCISIRTANVIRMDLDFGVSQDAISNIMAADNLSASEASKIARRLYSPEVDRMKEFWENPFPEDNRTWEEFASEMMWQLLVYDGLAVAPAFNLGAKCIGLEIIDAPTINILLNNYGRRPLPPAPAFQQNLWGYVRTEAVSSNIKGKTFQDGGAPYDVTSADVLSYFILNPRTNTPYGWSPVEKSLPIANLYAERLNWLMAEYKYGTSAKLYWRATDESITLQNLATSERIINEGLAGLTNARYQTKIMPPGLSDPFEVKNVDELYKADYDEHILKQIASFFNLQPSQLGVVTRAGLGGGKGSSEGEQDNAESVSSKPQNRQLEGIINSLSRQHLGCDSNVVAQLKDDEGSEDRLEQANAFKVYLSSAGMTANEVRGELGLALSTEPEADELAYVTASGPVFLKGLLESQISKEPSTNAATKKPGEPVGVNANGQETDNQENNPQEEGQHEGEEASSVVAKMAEVRAYKTFLANKTSAATREFEFRRHTPEEAESLKVGLAPLGKYRKPHRAEERLRSLAQSHSAQIAGALKLTGVTAAVAAAVKHAATGAHLLDDDTVTVIATLYSKQVGIDQKALRLRLTSLYSKAAKEAQDQFAAQTGKEIAAVDLEGLLSKADITISGIDATAQSRILTALKDGLIRGDSTSIIAKTIRDQVEGPMRLGQADLIARTETTRVYGQVFCQQLQSAGYTQWIWACEGGDPCQECLDQEGPHDMSEFFEPPHPNCECAPEAPGS